MLGLNINEQSLYSPGAFGNATIENANDTAAKYFDLIMEKEQSRGGIDAVIPLTHQTMSDDRELAELRPFPLIVGGHEHGYDQSLSITHTYRYIQ